MFHKRMFNRDAAISQNLAQAVGSGSARASTSGVLVTPETAMANSTLYSCVTLLAECVAQLPWELYRRTEDGGREKAINHPLYDVIRNQPNKRDTAFEYYERGQGFLGLEGNDFSLIERTNDGHVKELIPIDNKKITVYKSSDGLPFYQLQGYENRLSMRHVHHVKAFSLDGFVGVSPLQASPDAVGLALATDQHAASTFQSGALLSGVIEKSHESGKIESQQKIDALLAKFIERHGGGLRNAFSVALLQEGMTYKQLSMDNEKAQLLQSRAFGVQEVARLYKIPLHMIQHTEGSTTWGSGLEQMSIGFVVYTLLPWLKRREHAMMRDLLLPEERQEYFIEANVSGLLRGDQKSRYEAYAVGRQWGWLSVNDVRRMENMPPIVGGDSYLTPLNMVPAETAERAQQMTGASPEALLEIEQILNR